MRRTWWRGNNDEFLGRVARLAQKRRWAQLVKAFGTAVDKVQTSAVPEIGTGASFAGDDGSSSSKKQRKGGGSSKKDGSIGAVLRSEWTAFAADVAAAEAAATAAEGGFAFAFLEGALVKAVREGAWLLLDEVSARTRQLGATGVGTSVWVTALLLAYVILCSLFAI